MEHCDFAAIEALLRRHGFHFSKSMGQNFLIDASIPAAIAEASEAGTEASMRKFCPMDLLK